MPKFDEHCDESLKVFGNSFAEVHLWLDELAGTPEYGFRHRKIRHNEAGIRLIGKLFGDDALVAARQHIISDLKQEGWTENDHFPVDEADYVKMGLY